MKNSFIAKKTPKPKNQQTNNQKKPFCTSTIQTLPSPLEYLATS